MTVSVRSDMIAACLGVVLLNQATNGAVYTGSTISYGDSTHVVVPARNWVSRSRLVNDNTVRSGRFNDFKPGGMFCYCEVAGREVKVGDEHKFRSRQLLGRVLGLRGGGANGGVGADDARDIKVSVATTKISSYVDVRGDVHARSDWTVSRLMEELEKRFPGRPPHSVQRLFQGTQLLPGSMTLDEVSEGVEDGALSLLLDIPPPVDSGRFDPDTAVPSGREGQLEAFCSCLAAQNSLQRALMGVMRGEVAEDNPELTCSLDMKTDFDNLKEFFERTRVEAPEAPQSAPEEVHGPLHEAFRPLARRLDVDWAQSARLAFFIFICARFGSKGAVREASTALLIPLIFISQTRSARVARKIVWGMIPLVPGLSQLIVGFLQAPEQVLLTLDEPTYIHNLYGPGGPKQDPAFLQNEEGEEDGEDATTVGVVVGGCDPEWPEDFAVDHSTEQNATHGAHGEEADEWLEVNAAAESSDFETTSVEVEDEEDW